MTDRENDVLSVSADRPAFDPTRCINRRQRRFVCTVCSEHCPDQVFSLNAKETIRWQRCTDCGLCAALCPTRCFAPSANGHRQMSEQTDLSKGALFICDEAAAFGEKSVRCLAAIPWELLAVYAMNTHLTLCVGACERCERAEWVDCVREQLGFLHDFLGEERWKAQVTLADEAPEESDVPKEEKSVTRREMFAGVKRSMTKNLYQAAASRLPVLAGYEADPMQYRVLLAEIAAGERKRAQAAAQEGSEKAPPSFGVQLPRFTARCFGCGICEKMCPQKAIEIGPEAGGKRMIYLTPWRCTACGLCQKACPHGGIRELGTVSVPYLTRLPLVRVNSASCERCGTAIQPDSDPKYCPACKAKAPRIKK